MGRMRGVSLLLVPLQKTLSHIGTLGISSGRDEKLGAGRCCKRDRTFFVTALAIGLAVCRAGVVSAQENAGGEKPLAAGQRISLDLKGVDILDVLKLLSQKTGLNFVAGRNVSGRVTIFVKDVDVWDAFDLIIGANDLAYERHGEIVTVMQARDYELLYGERFQERKESLVVPLRYAKVTQVATVLNQIKSSVGRVVADEATNTLIISDVAMRVKEMKGVLIQLDRATESRVYQLNYAEAEKLKEKVQELLSPVGTFTFDARTNTAIVSDLKEILPRVEQVMRAFDLPEGQVLIESKIVNVTFSDDRSLGIDWQRIFSGVDTTLRTNFDAISGDVISGSGTSAPKGAAVQLISSDANAKVLIEALKTVGRVDTISNPRIMVSNNQEAKILIGSKEAFVTTETTIPSGGGPTINAPKVEFVDVGTKLYVTPSVKRDGYIQMKVRPEVSSVTKTIESISNTLIPIVQTTEADTNVLVKSGSTLIIAGLMENKDNFSENRIPGLGDIPVVGLPFRGTTHKKSKTELVIFLIPQIMLPDGSPAPAPVAAQVDALEPPAQEPAANIVLQDPVPTSYRVAVRRRLQEQLAQQFRLASLPQGSVEVSFILNHLGQVIGSPSFMSPQGDAFIQAAQEALAKAQPFEPFPEGASSGDVRFQVAVQYEPR